MANDFDAEMNAIMEGTIEQAPTQGIPAPAPGANSTPAEKTYKSAGRDWKGDDLAKAHDSLTREFGSRNKDWEEMKQLRDVKAQLAKDPEFNTYFRSAIEAYQKSRAAGQTQSTAQRQTGLPPEVAAKLEKVDRFEKLADRLEFEREESSVVKKYKLDDDTLKKVEDYSLAHNGLELEASYKQMQFDLNHQKMTDQKVKELAQRQNASRQSAPAAEHAIPSPKGVSLKSDADWRKNAGAELGKYFTNNE